MPPPTSLCIKCKEFNIVYSLQSSEISFCKNCFIDFIEHKFKTNLNHVGCKRGSNVLISLSGGSSSMSTLHILHKGSAGPRSRNGLIINVVHVNIGSLEDSWKDCMSLENRIENVKRLKEIVSNYGFNFVDIPLEAIFKNGESFLLQEVNESHTLKLKELFSSLTLVDNKEDMLRFLTRHLLRKVSVELGCNFILVGDNTSRIAQRILDDTVKGRGFSIPLDIQLKDERFNDITFIYPMRDVLAKQACLYAQYSKCETVFFPSFFTKSKAKDSICSLTSTLLARLQDNFPSTEPSVLRTGLKIELSSQALKKKESDVKDDEKKVEKLVEIIDLGKDEIVKRKWGGRRKKQEAEPLPTNLVLCPLCSSALPQSILHKIRPDFGSEQALCVNCAHLLSTSNTNVVDESLHTKLPISVRLDEEAMLKSIADFIL